MCLKLFFLISYIILSFSNETSSKFLELRGNKFYFKDQHIFLSGVNIAWDDYGNDFGNGRYEATRATLEGYIRQIHAAGGNSLRIWIHVEGYYTPQFNSDGYVTALDATGTFLNDMISLLDYAAEFNVFVVPVLWNGAVMTNPQYIEMLYDDSKLDSYINNGLRPMVRALREKPALGAWEIINEPEGAILVESNENPCYNTAIIGETGAGWTGNQIPMKNFLAFINKQNAAIREEDPKALITAGAWSERSQNSVSSDSFDHYTDECLVGAGGQQHGTIDFYQMHSYSWQGSWFPNSPFLKNALDFQLTKPIVLGEFSADCAENEGVEYLWAHIYNNNYTGAWSWQYNEGGGCADPRSVHDQGMTSIKGYTHNGIIPIVIGSNSPNSSSRFLAVYGKVQMIFVSMIFFYKLI